MRILLQQLSTGRFLSENGLWTADPKEAKPFRHFLEALVYARDYVEGPVGAYCVFRDSSYNFSVYLQDVPSALGWDARIRAVQSLASSRPAGTGTGTSSRRQLVQRPCDFN